MTRVVLTAVLLLAFVAQAASAVQARACPMLERAARGEQPACEHCPPPPDVALRAELPECCVLHAVTVETSVSEPARAPQASAAVALAPPRVVLVPR